jgi:hypothetical protein
MKIRDNAESLVSMTPAGFCTKKKIIYYTFYRDILPFIAGIVYIGEPEQLDVCDKHKVANISANFRKPSNWPQWDTHAGARGKLIHEA